MLTPVDVALKAVASSLGKELLSELWYAPWEDSHIKVIEGAGVAFATHPGLKRARNEDRVVVAHISAIGGQQFLVALVCDGVGGSEMGDVAATLAIATILEELALVKTAVALGKLLEQVVRKADKNIQSQLAGRGTTTLSAVLATSPREVVAANIGDSRIFSWSPGKSINQVSTDDTLENELRNFALKDVSALDARGLRGSLSQALGEIGRPSEQLRVQIFDRSCFDKGVIIASDGAWKGDEFGFGSIAMNAESAPDMVRRSMALAGWTGGVDNISVIAIEDLMRFTTLGGNPARVRSGGAAATVWVCDTKFVVRECARFSGESRKEGNDRTASKSDGDTQKTKRRSSGRRKQNGPKGIQEVGQLDLMQDAGVGIRPKVEIYTDNDEPAN